MALASLACSSFCYSDDLDTVYGSTQNAAAEALRWSMTNVLPQQSGLTVGGVFYRYTAIKNPEDEFVVSVQNENARGAGYIFREVDDWTGLPSNTITKIIPVDNIDISYWGVGSIEGEGFGTVQDPSVIYTYQYDPCHDPQSRPDCPGYELPIIMELNEVEIVDPLDADYIQDEIDRKAVIEDDEQEDNDRKKVLSEKEIEERLEAVLGIVNTTLLAAEAQARHDALLALASLPMSYVSSQIVGGVYEETTSLIDTDIPDNKDGLRNNLAQQLKHQEMVDLQYGTQ